MAVVLPPQTTELQMHVVAAFWVRYAVMLDACVVSSAVAFGFRPRRSTLRFGVAALLIFTGRDMLIHRSASPSSGAPGGLDRAALSPWLQCTLTARELRLADHAAHLMIVNVLVATQRRPRRIGQPLEVEEARLAVKALVASMAQQSADGLRKVISVPVVISDSAQTAAWRRRDRLPDGARQAFSKAAAPSICKAKALRAFGRMLIAMHRDRPQEIGGRAWSRGDANERVALHRARRGSQPAACRP